MDIPLRGARIHYCMPYVNALITKYLFTIIMSVLLAHSLHSLAVYLEHIPVRVYLAKDEPQRDAK